MKTTKKIHLEIIRIIALVCIIYNHTGERGNNVYMFTDGNVTFVFSLVADILCKIGVPLFVMVSGALLLQKEERIQEIYHKRVLRIVKVIVLFTTLRYFYECFLVESIPFSLLGLIKLILNGKLFAPYWFLYSYLSLLFVLPFIKRMIKSMDKKEIDVLIVLIFVFYTVLPIISGLFDLEFEILFMFGAFFSYFVLGYYLECVIDNNAYTRKNIVFAMLGIAVSVIYSCWMIIRNRAVSGVIAAEYSSVLSIPIAFFVFFIVKAIWGKNAEKKGNMFWRKNITIIGSCSFGIYLIEDYLRNGLSFICDNLTPYVTALPACAIWLIAVLVVGVGIVSVLKKIPGLKEIL